ncbi:hypothetical protein [Kitasatospora sp. NPDC088783]|uniref:hypothetical protein n=1 Tax=Kitasatospora sp. NPDC088783 TaxID=3364077 RepID=UPI003815B042
MFLFESYPDAVPVDGLACAVRASVPEPDDVVVAGEGAVDRWLAEGRPVLRVTPHGLLDPRRCGGAFTARWSVPSLCAQREEGGRGACPSCVDRILREEVLGEYGRGSAHLWWRELSPAVTVAADPAGVEALLGLYGARSPEAAVDQPSIAFAGTR